MTGLVKLRETSGHAGGRVHGIYLRRGLVVAVDTPVVRPSSVLGDTARRPMLDRLEALFALSEAVLTFHVACAPPEEPVPLAPRDYLHGRPRARDRGAPASARATTVVSRARAQALSALGLDGNATAAEVTRAFRRRARELHPDLHKGAERRTVEQRFAALTAAYHSLIG